MPYFRLAPSINRVYGITGDPDLPPEICFLAGRVIGESLPAPLFFEVNHPRGENPRHLLGSVVPVVSEAFRTALLESGVDNFQVFPALLRNPDTGAEWQDYHAFNVVGLVDAVDMGTSEYDTIMPGSDDEDEVPAVLDLKRLIFAQSKTRDLPMFRIVQDPTQIFVSERVMEGLRSRKPEGGWGMTSYEIPVSDR